MTNCIFYSLFFILFLNFSFGTLRYSQINRAFESSYKSVYESAVITVDEGGNPIYPYYSQNLLTEYLTDFVEITVSKYTDNYDLKVNFYLEDGTTTCSNNEKARCVEVKLETNINYLFTYSREQKYFIKERKNL